LITVVETGAQDESAVLGAVFYAAHLSTSIKVPEHKIKDITPYGVTATIKLARSPDVIDVSDKVVSAAGSEAADDDDDSADELSEEVRGGRTPSPSVLLHQC
jgi:hypothetical protein